MSEEVEKAKEIAILHYKLLMENNKEEWTKTLRPFDQNQVDIYGSSPYFWWITGRRMVEKAKNTYSFKEFDEGASDDEYKKFWFNRLDKDGKPAGSGKVPIVLMKNQETDNEWRVSVSSW